MQLRNFRQTKAVIAPVYSTQGNKHDSNLISETTYFSMYVHVYLLLGVVYSLVWHQWMVDSSIADGITSTGYLTSKTMLTSAKCIIECTQMPACKMVGFSEGDGICNLYSVVLTNDHSFGFQSSTTFYRGNFVRKMEKYTYNWMIGQFKNTDTAGSVLSVLAMRSCLMHYTHRWRLRESIHNLSYPQHTLHCITIHSS